MINDILSSIENELYELVGAIDYGEISNIGIPWKSLSNSLGELKEFGYKVEEEPVNLSAALRPFLQFMDADLRDIAEEMEELCEGGGSSDAIADSDIQQLQNLSETFEEKFLEFIDNIRQREEHDELY